MAINKSFYWHMSFTLQIQESFSVLNLRVWCDFCRNPFFLSHIPVKNYNKNKIMILVLAWQCTCCLVGPTLAPAVNGSSEFICQKYAQVEETPLLSDKALRGGKQVEDHQGQSSCYKGGPQPLIPWLNTVTQKIVGNGNKFLPGTTGTTGVFSQ